MLLAQVLVVWLLLLVGLAVPLLLKDAIRVLVPADCYVPGDQIFSARILEGVIVVDVSMGIFVHIGRHASLMVTETFYGQILEVWI